MLIGVVVSSIIIAAMYTTYTVVNNSYSQVTDVASVSRSGRDVVAMLMRDIEWQDLNIITALTLKMKQNL